MVKHDSQAKDSSKRRRSDYQFRAFIDPSPFLPETIKTRVLTDSTGKRDYAISGTLYKEPDQREWQEPPHLAFANLRVEDPQSAEAFIRRYGPLYEGSVRLHPSANDEPIESTHEFTVETAALETSQNELRAAWEGDPNFLVIMEAQVEENMPVDVRVEGGTGEVLLKPNNLQALISFLFLRDYYAGKIGVCGNPDCPARYFRKKRRNQKFCEAGPCVEYAQRQYSLQWWHREGKKRREKRAKSPSRRKKR